MSTWTEEQLRDAVSKKGNLKATTDIICKFFLDAVSHHRVLSCPESSPCLGDFNRSSRRSTDGSGKSSVHQGCAVSSREADLVGTTTRCTGSAQTDRRACTDTRCRQALSSRVRRKRPRTMRSGTRSRSKSSSKCAFLFAFALPSSRLLWHPQLFLGVGELTRACQTRMKTASDTSWTSPS